MKLKYIENIVKDYLMSEKELTEEKINEFKIRLSRINTGSLSFWGNSSEILDLAFTNAGIKNGINLLLQIEVWKTDHPLSLKNALLTYLEEKLSDSIALRKKLGKVLAEDVGLNIEEISIKYNAYLRECSYGGRKKIYESFLIDEVRCKINSSENELENIYESSSLSS